MKILISACLLGEPCRYDGRSKPCVGLQMLRQTHTLIPVCPEVMGGLPTPRPPAERVGDEVLRADGASVTQAYRRGAEQTLRCAQREGATLAVLKERSPSCGKGEIYDGSFQGRLTVGDGVTAALLQENGIEVIGETEALLRLQTGRL